MTCDDVRVTILICLGAAYVYVTYDSGETWSEKQKLLAADGAGGDWFGRAVAVHNRTIVVGSRNSEIGISAGECMLSENMFSKQ